jgi:hypothetical protein
MLWGAAKKKPNDLEFSGEHQGSAVTEVIVRCNS